MGRLDDMETFVRVVEAGSFTAAATQLNLAKSAVSRRVSDLEEHLGVRLLNRTTRRLNLTETGSLFYERCQELLLGISELEQETRGEHASLRGKLKIACPLTFGNMHLGPAILDFLEIHPDLDLDLNLDDRKIDMVKQGVDLAVRIGKLPETSVVMRKFAVIKRYALASPEYLTKYGEPKTPDDLVHHRALAYANISDSEAWTFFSAEGEKSIARPEIRIRANTSGILRQAALAGYGIVTLPDFIVYQDVLAGKLVPVLPDYRHEPITAFVMYPVGARLSQRARVFIDFLIERFGENACWRCAFRN